MEKLILVSILIATIVLPARAAREPDPGRAFRKLVVSMAIAGAAYLFALVVVYQRF
jgi:hypothetical protein